MSLYLLILLGAGFLVLWYTAHRLMRRDGNADGNVDAFASLKKVTLALLIVFAFVTMQVAVGAAVWFGLAFFLPGLSAEWRMQLAIAAAMMAWVIVFAAPWKVVSKGGNK